MSPDVSQRRGNSFTLSLSAGYYNVGIYSRQCHGERYVAVLPSHDRTFHVHVRCGDKAVRLVDVMHGLAGSIPASVRSVSMWPAEGGRAPISAELSGNAYYFDEANCGHCVLELTLSDGRRARVSAVPGDGANFSITRRDISILDVKSGLAVHGSPFNAPETLIEGPARSIWALDRLGNRVAVVIPGQRCHEYDLPSPFSDARDIVATKNAVWISEPNSGNVVRFRLDGSKAEFHLTSPGVDPRIIGGADGRVWYVNDDADVGAIDDAGNVSRYIVPGRVDRLILGRDGRMWAVGDTSVGEDMGSFLATMDGSGKWRRVVVKTEIGEVKSANNGFWVTHDDALGFVSFSGDETFIRLPIKGMEPKMYAVDNADRLWFSDRYGNVVAIATPDGTVEESYTDYGPPGISDMRLDSKGSAWIAEPMAHVIEQYGKGAALPPRQIRPKNLLFTSNGDLWYSDPVADVIGLVRKDGTSHCYAFRLSHVLSCRFMREDIMSTSP